jgi:type II secretory pathway component GspD/PulD (secretin)
MVEIAKTIDVATPVLEDVFVRQIKNAAANDIKTALETIVQESQKELEKSGKAPAQNTAQPYRPWFNRPNGGPGSLLRRTPDANNQPAPAANNASVVMAVSDADRGMIRGKVLILADERSNKLIIITQKSNMDFFDKVIEQLDVETTPDTVVKVYRLKYADAEEVSDMINDLIGNAASSKDSNKNQNAAAKQGQSVNLSNNRTPVAKKPANQRSGEASAGELSKDNTTVLADKRINGLVVMTDKKLVSVLENIIESMDIKLSQVLIETCIIEVTLGDNLKTGIDWLQQGEKQYKPVQRVDSSGNKLFYKRRTVTSSANPNQIISTSLDTTSMVPGWYNESSVDADGNTITYVADKAAGVFDIVSSGRGNFVNNGHYSLGGGGGSAAGTLNSLMGSAAEAAVGAATNSATSSVLASGGISPAGAGLNYFLKSDKLNLAAVIHASKTDSRAKYIASPIVMTVDNKEATIDATENRQFLTGWTAQSGGSWSGSGQPTPNYSAKDIGIKLKITPKINPNGTVMLEVEEEYSQFVQDGQNMLIPQGEIYVPGKVDLAVERKLSADILLENAQTVVLGGLTETSKAESETGIPILKDIPWIGKWLFGTVSQNEARKELLIFMTPYVLDEGEAAQLEALRRKKSLSDSRPWEDHGWSASNLADPVSKKEQMRRLKEEWAKQDEERQTKIAIEKMKVERAKKLKELSKEEREVWLKMHKEELEKEEQQELEKKMLDEKSQEELKALVEKIKKDKLESAQKEIDKAEEMTRAENERAKLDAEKISK